MIIRLLTIERPIFFISLYWRKIIPTEFCKIRTRQDQDTRLFDEPFRADSGLKQLLALFDRVLSSINRAHSCRADD